MHAVAPLPQLSPCPFKRRGHGSASDRCLPASDQHRLPAGPGRRTDPQVFQVQGGETRVHHAAPEHEHGARAPGTEAARCLFGEVQVRSRSEEHTSELQSPCNLVCRLLLEKKKINYTRAVTCLAST